ncbi:MAG: SelT/SelW/SelH family protein [Gammaproteobacteria bacterium]|nr:SelT/SelW/SelH family protein [Gammaproteobacteria bacterium]
MQSAESRPGVRIVYCTQCRFILRAAWLAQELLMTFAEELGEVALVPGRDGIFEVRLNDELLFSRKNSGRFPESSELKQLLRDRIAPGKDLGHSEKK